MGACVTCWYIYSLCTCLQIRDGGDEIRGGDDEERSGSVVECKTCDRRVAGL